MLSQRTDNGTLQPSIHLQISALQHVPTPILVLSPSRTTVLANLAAEKLLGKGLEGRYLDDLGIDCCYDHVWGNVLNRAAVNIGTEVVDEVVVQTYLQEKYFRILVAAIRCEEGIHWILSFERTAHLEKMIIPGKEKISLDNEGLCPKPNSIPVPISSEVEAPRDIHKIKRAVFDSCETMAFILTVDEKFYLANKKTRSVLGDIMGGKEGCDGLGFRKTLEIWDETITRRLEQSEFPGMRLVRNRTPFMDFRCGFTHMVTGDKVVMNVRGECLYDDDTGEFLGGICWCRDLQEYSHFVSQQQQKKLESHETICNYMPHMVWTTLPDGNADWFSDRWYEFTGMTKEESVGWGFANAIHPEDLPVLLAKWKFHTEAGTECSVEARYRRYDGVYKWMLDRACPLRDNSGKLLKWYGTTTDIHDLVMARITDRRNKEQVITVLAHAEVNLFAINKERIVTMAEGGMTWPNRHGSVTNKSSFVGMDAIDAAHRTQEGGMPEYEKNVVNILAGQVPMASSEDRVGDRIYRTRLVAELEHNPLDGGSKPEMSHEMRTPTAGVIGMVELLSDDKTLTQEQREYVNSIQLSAKALLTIVNDILDFSKIESGRLDIEEVPFSLSAIVSELCKLLSMFANQKGLQFVYEDAMDENLELIGDPGRIRQVLSNLLTNALKFTKEGMVKIMITSVPRTSAANTDEILDVKFVIEDTGIGIEKEVLDKLFRPFSQGDSSTARLYGGTGLGLTISRNLASLMKGSIDLQSAPKNGSRATFTVPLRISSRNTDSTLRRASSPSLHELRHHHDTNSLSKIPSWKQPLAHRSISQDLLNQQISASVTNYSSVPREGWSSRQSSIDAGSSVSSFRGGSPTGLGMSAEQRKKCHVLVVEDNAINQTIAIKNIRKLGFPVTAVWNGKEALSYLQSPSAKQPRPSIILMDVQMPVMDGYQATKILRRSTESLIEGISKFDKFDVNSVDGATEIFKIDEVDGKEWKEGTDIHLKDIPVIAMTASAIQGDREKCTAAGMDDYLAKPVEKGRLEEMLVKWAGKRRDG
ncbi:hypothetical protein BGZ60DRAFT_433470 [Tricladium varicosporioides]|nr:hypothetical protein BGZ60DRAFT_433470 [Hymenoscyphus varicosporioides]